LSLPLSDEDTFYEIGIDYITATTMVRYSPTSLDSFGRHLVDEQVKQGEKLRDFRSHGYYGRAAGQVSYGRRSDGAVVRLSGKCAFENWEQCVSLATNVSRLDVQATVTPDGGPTLRLERHHAEALNSPRGRGKQAQLKYWGGPTGIESLALGSRQSDRYLRIYNKGIQSGLVQYDGTLRYEIEFKNKLAWEKAQLLDSSDQQHRYIVAWIYEMACVRGIRLAGATWRTSLADRLRTGECPNLPHHRSRNDKRIWWLANSVKPSVVELVHAGRLDETLEALGLSDLVIIRQQELDQRKPN
jgi:hypothetical protein